MINLGERMRGQTMTWAIIFQSLLMVAALSFCPNAPARASELVVYSGRKESAIKPVVELFERKTGTTVALKVGKTSGLAN